MGNIKDKLYRETLARIFEDDASEGLTLYVMQSIANYIVYHKVEDDFLLAVLTNDLKWVCELSTAKKIGRASCRERV